MIKFICSAVLLVLAASAVAACDVGVYSAYILGNGGVAGLHNEPVVQGSCTKGFANGVFANLWVSQSLRDPGVDKTFGNEVDYTIGWGGQLSSRVHATVAVGYWDITNPKVFSGTNGDVFAMTGNVSYAITDSTSSYVLYENYSGLGSRGFDDGWKAGVGARTAIGENVSIDASVMHTTFGARGDLAKIVLSAANPIAKLAGGEIRAAVTFWQPAGSLREEDRRSHVVTSVTYSW